ncbi:MAG: response regulator [Candidatus Latescibacteria bacterium]|nr:response regulator [Candidatus Latescibacterota bacterium]
MTILVVDDQENMCWILSKVLAEAGFSVKTAETAGVALSIAAVGVFSAAIFDYRLPDMDGLNLFSEIRKYNPKIPAVLITSYGSKQLREDALQLGFSAYFDKPFDNHTLITSIHDILAETFKDSAGN